MADDKRPPRRWSLEEIDELLQDSGVTATVEEGTEPAPKKKAESVDPRPGRSETIEHHIISDETEHSDGSEGPQVYGSFVSDKYRDRFFNRPVQNLERTAEHVFPSQPASYERSGFVRKKSAFEATGDFSPVPTLVPDGQVSDEEGATDKTIVFSSDTPVDEEAAERLKKAKTRTIGLRSLAVTDGDAHEEEFPLEEESTQLSFEGFGLDEKVDVVDESQVEEELSKKRKAKAESFTITSDISSESEDESSKKYGTDEYRTADDKFKVSYYLKKNKNNAFICMVASYICAGILLALSILAVAIPENGTLFAIASLCVLVVSTVFGLSSLLDGVASFKGLNFNRNTGVFVGIVAAYIQNIAFLFSKDGSLEGGICLIGAAAVLPLAFNKTAEYLEYKRIQNNFEFITGDEIYSIGKIEKKETAFEIGRGLLLDEPAVLSSQKTAFPRKFLEFSGKYYPSDEINKKLVPIGVAISVLIGAITLLITKNIFGAVTAFTASVCVSIPYFSYFSDTLSISSVSSALIKKGGMISGWEALKMCEEANAIAIDAADVFDEHGGNVYGIHQFYDIQIDEAILYTASLLINSGGPLGNLFKRVIVGEYSLLPPVDTLVYEDKLGLSAWIFNRRILVGNEDLLRNHNVEIKDKALIERHLCEGRYPLYLAIDGKAAAVFIVSYDVSQENAKLLRDIEKHSISLLIKTDDANITDEMVSEKLNMPQSGVKVLSAVSGDIYKDYRVGVTSAADALLMHDGKTHSFMSAVSSALSLDRARHLINIFQICAMGIGLALVSALSFVSGLETLSCTQLLVIQGFFTGFCAFALSGKKIGAKKIKKKNK